MTNWLATGAAVQTELDGGIDAAATTITIKNASGWPAPTGGQVSMGMLNREGTTSEKFTFTGRSGTSLTGVTRGADGTTAASWGAGTVVEHVVGAVQLNEANDSVNDHLFVRKTADELVTNSAVLQNDDHLVLALLANRVYSFDGLVSYYCADVAADIKLGFTVPAGATLRWAGAGPASTGAAIGSGLWQPVSASGTAIPFGCDASLETAVHVRGVVAMGSTAGNLQLQWAQNAASTTALAVHLNSWLRALRHP